jgi:hypothetical protein
MRRIMMTAVAAVALAAATSASASSIFSTNPVVGALSTHVINGTEDLTNNGPFASGSILAFPPYGAWLFDEGVQGNTHSYLLHYDRGGGARSIGLVAGSFKIQLASNEVFSVLADNSFDLLATDPANGVAYQTAAGTATTFRGVEGLDLYGFNQAGNLVTVGYALGSDGLSLDEVRFGVTAVPEPSAWALLIAGFGMMGAALRRSRRTLAPA